MSEFDDDTVLIPVRAIGGKLDNDDPNYAAGSPDLYLTLALAYDSLAAPTGKRGADEIWTSDYSDLQPRLAVEWTEQGDGSWVVTLRRGVSSQFGNVLIADDVAWAFEKAFKTRNMACWRWREVVGLTAVEVLGSHALKFRLRAPYPTFPNWLLSVTPNMVDSRSIQRHASADDPWGVNWLNKNVAGFGAFALEQMDGEHLVFRGRENYWMGAAPAASIEVRKWPDARSAIGLLDENRPVVIVGPDIDETMELLARDDVSVERAWAGHVSVEIDFTAEPFADLRVRHALAYATPYARLIADGLRGLARPWRSPVKAVSQWYSDRHWPFRHDVRQARELLAEAGFAQGLKSDFYVPRRADCLRMAEIMVAAWAEAGVELVVKDMGSAPPGWLPPLHLRTECAHNMSEPLYDIAHDYAVMDPILPLPGGPPQVGHWIPRFKKNPAALGLYAEALLERDPERKRACCVDLQTMLVDFSSSIFIAEVQQVLVANRKVPAGLLSPQARFFQALQYQNCASTYLPERSVA
jgi:ABC-type transport system substrate-binding protein